MTTDNSPIPPEGCTCGALWTVRSEHGKSDCPVLLTSEDWAKLIDNPKWKILDPDAWDRKNFQYSWHEERITANEFRLRAMLSTGQWPLNDYPCDRLVKKYGDSTAALQREKGEGV